MGADDANSDQSCYFRWTRVINKIITKALQELLMIRFSQVYAYSPCKSSSRIEVKAALTTLGECYGTLTDMQFPAKLTRNVLPELGQSCSRVALG
jgi:hypothetical protein